MSASNSAISEKEIEWRRRLKEMQERLKNHLDENTVEGKREHSLYHGLKLVSSTTTLGKFVDICYCEETQEYLVIDPPSNMLRYSVQGKLIQPSYALSTGMLFTKLLWCQKDKVLIGYIPNDDIIWLMTSFCMLYQVVRNEFRITSIFYEPSTNEAVVAGPNKVTRYPLASKETTMNACKTMSYIDSEYGTLWKLECASLIPASTSMLRMAGSYRTTIYILPLDTSKEKEDTVPIMYLARNLGATEANITALFFQADSQWVITGDEQGNVMGWDLELYCVMSCPRGHSGCVRLIVSHPAICGFVTYAKDSMLQIWSCNLRGKVESFTDVGEIWGISVNESAAAIATLGQKLNCFDMHQLYTFYAALSAPATQIISTANPMYSTRVLVRSADNIIRILTSPTGKQTNLQLLPRNLHLVSMAYSGSRERLYTIILKTGEVLLSNIRTNPMDLKHVWVSDECVITCITAYEYYEEVRGPDLQPQKPRVIDPKYTLIFAGTEDGNILNIDESSGKHVNKFAAHNGPVTRLCSSTISRLVVSAGIDKCVKAWRVYPDLKFPLAVTYSVYYTVPITQIVTMGSIMCMVSSTSKSLIHQLFMYATVGSDHHPSKDHNKQIVDIAALESLQICATSSMDRTIRLWDQQNNLIKVLEINTCANTIAFSSLRGDIIFGAGRHLYRIFYRNHLAPKYRARILVNRIPEEMEEDALTENKEYNIYDDVIDRKLLLHPVSSVPLGSLDNSDGAGPRLELMIQQQICAQLERRDQDIANIQIGEIKSMKLVAQKSLMNHDAWEKYLEDILDATNKPGAEVPEYNIGAVIDKHKSVKRIYNKPGVFKKFYGYSIEKFPEYPDAVPDTVKHPRMPLVGFLPNSIMYKLFSNEDIEHPLTPEPKPLLKYEYPSEFQAEQPDENTSRFDSKMEITPSQLLNMTRFKDSDSDIAILRMTISENQSPFFRMAQFIDQSRSNGKIKKYKKRPVYRGGIRKKKTCVKKKTGQKHKSHDSQLPWTIEKIIYGNKEKLEKILSHEIGNKRNRYDLSWDSDNRRILHEDFSATAFGNSRASAIDKESVVSRSKKLFFEGIQKFTKRQIPDHKVSWRAKLETSLPRRVRKGLPNCDSKNISKDNMQPEFTDIADLAEMSMKRIIARKQSIKKTLKNYYNLSSKVQKVKIKDVLLMLAARSTDTPSSFAVTLQLLNILPSQDIDIVGFLCAIFIVTSRRIIRKSIIKHLKNHGLCDPQKILTQQLLLIKNTITTNDFCAVRRFISGIIYNWMHTLEKHVALVSANIERGNDLKSVRRFLQNEDRRLTDDSVTSSCNAEATNITKSEFAKEIHKQCSKWNRRDLNDKSCSETFTENRFFAEPVISPIDGINHFCEMNRKLPRTIMNVQRSNKAWVNPFKRRRSKVLSVKYYSR